MDRGSGSYLSGVSSWSILACAQTCRQLVTGKLTRNPLESLSTCENPLRFTHSICRRPLKFLSPSVRVPLLVFAPDNASMLAPRLECAGVRCRSSCLETVNHLLRWHTHISTYHLLVHVSVRCKIRP